MKRKLTKPELAKLLPKIQSVLETGVQLEDGKLHYPAGAIIDAVMQIPGIKKADTPEEWGGGQDGFSTNGWEWDWVQHFSYAGKLFILTGSGYNGGHSFEPDDE